MRQNEVADSRWRSRYGRAFEWPAGIGWFGSRLGICRYDCRQDDTGPIEFRHQAGHQGFPTLIVLAAAGNPVSGASRGDLPDGVVDKHREAEERSGRCIANQ
jgi:hypothetical protein